MLTLERAATRFLQMQAIEATVRTLESSIEGVESEIEEAEGRLKELRSQRTEQLRALRATARDEGELPLIDLMDALPADIPVITLMQDLRGQQGGDAAHG